MKDTSPIVEKKWREIMMKKSAQERLNMAMSMLATAKTLMKAGILAANPHLSEKMVKKEMLLRLYKNDFSESVLNEIAQKL